jgi:hypothetical protein
MIESEQLISASDPPLADTVRLMMPSAPTKLLMQAALLQGDLALEAWSKWRQTIDDPRAFLASDRTGIKRHLPLLYRNLMAHRADLGRDLEPYFRAARAREELRSVRYRRFLGEALDALSQGGIDFVVGKGVTFGETIHTDPVLRHCHDIDLLVHTAHLPAVANALYRAGFLPAKSGPHDEPRFDHASGLPVELHDRLYRTPFYDGSLNDVWNRARTAVILGVSVHLISDVDLLVQAPVHASLVSQRYNLSWIIDVVHLLRQRESEAATIDWCLVKRIAGDTDAELPLYVTYQYLAATFHVPIPQDVIDELRRSAAKAGRLQHLVALDGLRAAPRTRFKLLLQASGWRSRRAIAVAMLLPPVEYLKRKHPKVGAGALALLYLARPLWFAGKQLGKARHRFRQRWFNSGPTEPQRAFLARLLPEERLLLGCIRRELSNDVAQAIAGDLHDKPIRWMIVLETAKRQGIEPLLWSNLKKCREQGLAVPADVLKCLRGAMFSAIETKERQARQLRDVLEFMNRHRLAIMLIKGAALDAVVFQTPWHVVSLDIDLIIREPVEDVPKPISDQIWSFNRDGPFECDFACHHDLSIDGVLPIDYREIWRDARRVTVQGQDVYVMCPEDMLIATCINSCRRRFFQLKSLYGIREILAGFKDLDWDRVAKKAANYQCRAIVYAALTVARLAVDANVADASLRLLKVGFVQAAIIRFLAGRRSFTPVTGRNVVMNERQYTLWTKRVASLANLSVILPYAAYTWRQRTARLRWLSQTEAMSKPWLFQAEAIRMELSADPSPPVGGIDMDGTMTS